MGLQQAPACFFQLMEAAMRDTQGILVYLEDRLIHSKDNQSNLAAMEVAFQRLRRFGLRLNPAKCEFAVERIPYLGFMLSKDGVTPGEDKLRAIREFPVPDTITKLRELAGVCNYF